MKKAASAFLILSVAAAISFAAPARRHTKESKARTKTFAGEIYDAPCAKKGSHTEMETMMGLKEDSKMCTLKCVEMGAKFVLYNAAKKATYELDDQQKPKDFAGQKVRVTGTYDATTKTIHVEKIEAAK